MRINLPETNLVKTGRCLTTSENITTPVKHNPLVSWSRHRLGASNPRNQRKRTLRSRVSDTVRVPNAAKLLNVDRCSSRDGACNDRRSSLELVDLALEQRGVAYAIRLPANQVLERAIEDLLTRWCATGPSTIRLPPGPVPGT